MPSQKRGAVAGLMTVEQVSDTIAKMVHDEQRSRRNYFGGFCDWMRVVRAADTFIESRRPVVAPKTPGRQARAIWDDFFALPSIAMASVVKRRALDADMAFARAYDRLRYQPSVAHISQQRMLRRYLRSKRVQGGL